MIKKGFTLIELLAVICIMAVLALIAVPTYIGVSNNIKQKAYETKISLAKNKAINYASDKNEFLFDIKTLIQDGYLEADNELGQFLNPVNNDDMRCYIINVVYNNNQYEANVTENKECMTKEQLEENYSALEIVFYKDEGLTKEASLTDDNWTRESPLYASYRFRNDSYKNNEIKELIWSGEENLTCSSDNLSNCLSYKVVTDDIKEITLNLQVTFQMKNGVTYTSLIKKTVKIDKQVPKALLESLQVNNDAVSKDLKRITMNVSDGNGSGVKWYAITQESLSCNDIEYQNVNDNEIVHYLNNGKYKVCVKDKVGNLGESSVFEVKNVDQEKPSIDGFAHTSASYANPLYNKNLTIKVMASDKESSINEIHYCTTTESECTPDTMISASNGNASIALPDNDGFQTLCATAIDAAGNESDKQCYGSFWKKENITMGDLGIICGANNTYCEFDNGIYVKYGSKVFTIYKDYSSSIYGLTRTNTDIPLINVGCCDSGKCHIKFVYSSEGVPLSLSATFNSLPSSRTSVTNLDSFRYGIVTSSSFKNIKNNPNVQTNKEHKITSFSLDELPDTLNDGYGYGLPSENMENVNCYIEKDSSTEKINFFNRKYLTRIYLYDNKEQKVTKSFKYNVGDKFVVTCKKENEDGESEEIKKEVVIGANPDNLTDNNRVDSGVTISNSSYIKMENSPLRVQKSRNGLLDIEEYQNIRSKKYASNFNTLLSTVINSVVYKGDSHSYGHDGVYSSISAIYASQGGYVALTPMNYGKRSSLMSVPFNKTVKIKSGIGTQSDPFVIE